MRIAGLIAVAGALLAAPLVAQTPVSAPDTTKPKKAPPKVDISKLKFMSGCWEGETGKDQRAEEIWTMPSENLLVSTTRYFTQGARQSATTSTGSKSPIRGVVLGITAKGKPEETYLMKTLVDEYVMFENPAKKEFPQRIMYRLASDGVADPAQRRRRSELRGAVSPDQVSRCRHQAEAVRTRGVGVGRKAGWGAQRSPVSWCPTLHRTAASPL